MKQEVLGQPVWLWALGAVAIVGGYWYFSSKASASSASSGSPAVPQQKSSSTTTLKETITDWQGPPKRKHKAA